MRRSRKPIKIASRRSELAKVQARAVGRALGKLNPGVVIDYVWIDSQGDQTPGPLTDVGGKGLFTRAVDEAVLRGDADVAVHCMKDLPVVLPPGISLAAVPKRGDARDCLIARGGITAVSDLPSGATVGTSSPRRAAQLLALRRDLEIESIRGNVPTRLEKVLGEAAEAMNGPQATVLAAAGLVRLGRRDLTQAALAVEVMLPAAGQGALALHCRADDHVTLTRCLPLNHAETATAVNTERLVLEGLEATCQSPIAVYAQTAAPPTVPHRNADAHWYRLRIQLLSHDGTRQMHVDDVIKAQELRRAVKQHVQTLRDQGAMDLIRGM